MGLSTVGLLGGLGASSCVPGCPVFDCPSVLPRVLSVVFLEGVYFGPPSFYVFVVGGVFGDVQLDFFGLGVVYFDVPCGVACRVEGAVGL